MTDNAEFIETPFIVGIIFLVLGTILYFFPPKKMNHFYGYRTPKSMTNETTWAFAQKYSSVKMIQGGLFLLFVYVISFISNFPASTDEIIGLITLLGVVIFMIFSTEKAIKTKFPNL